MLPMRRVQTQSFCKRKISMGTKFNFNSATVLFPLLSLVVIVAIAITAVNYRSSTPPSKAPVASAAPARAPASDDRLVAVAEVGYDSQGNAVAVRPAIFNADKTSVCVGETRGFDAMVRPFAMVCGGAGFVNEDNLSWRPIPLGRFEGAPGSVDSVTLRTSANGGRKTIAFVTNTGVEVRAHLAASKTSDRPDQPTLVWDQGEAREYVASCMLHLPEFVIDRERMTGNEMVCQFDGATGDWKSPLGYYVKDGDGPQSIFSQAVHAFVWEACVRF